MKKGVRGAAYLFFLSLAHSLLYFDYILVRRNPPTSPQNLLTNTNFVSQTELVFLLNTGKD